MLTADTLIEDDDAYRFGNEVQKLLDVEWVVIAEGRDPFQVCKDEKFMVNSRIDPCSKILKRNFLTKWIRSNYSHDYCEVHLGIDYSEFHRLVEVSKRYAPYVYRSTLVEDGRIIHKSFSEQFGIKRPRLYDWGLGRNNCGGFCGKAGLGHYKALYDANLERYIELENKELDVYDHIGRAYPFLKKQVKGVKMRLTLRDYRVNFLEKGLVSAEESQEFGGCGCAI